MARNMKAWLKEYMEAPVKKALPILSFPGAQLIGHTVDELVRDGHLQALCMEAIAKKYDMGAAVSLMDLSVEAEAFGAEVIFSEDDVPTMHGALIADEDAADAIQAFLLDALHEEIYHIYEIDGRTVDKRALHPVAIPATVAMATLAASATNA